MPETLLQPPVVCCGKEYGSQRALDAHRGSHRVCPSCSFEGSKFALSQHTCGVEAPAGPSLPLATTAEFTRKDGSFFTVVDEAVADELPLETRFPGARIVRAVPPPVSGGECPEPQPSVALPAIAVSPLDDEWRVVLVLGRTGSGKSRALAALGTALGGAAWQPSWEAEQAVVSQFGGGEAAVRWLGAVGLNALPLWCAPFHTLSTGEGARAVLARQLQHAEQTASPLLVDDFGQAGPTVNHTLDTHPQPPPSTPTLNLPPSTPHPDPHLALIVIFAPTPVSTRTPTRILSHALAHTLARHLTN